MKNHWLFFCFLFLITPFAQAQVVEWGNQQKTKSKVYYTQVLGENSSGVFIARARTSEFRREIVIEKYKSNLVVDIAKDLPQPENSWVERAIVTETGLLQFSTYKNANGNAEMQLQLIDNSLNVISTKVLFEVDGELNNEKRMLIRHSVDKKSFAIVFITKGKDKSKSVINLYGFDGTLSQRFNRKFGLDYGAEDVFLSNMECDNDGNVFALVDFPKEGRKPRDYRPRNYFLYSYFAAKDNMLEYAIGKDSVIVNDLAIVVNNYAKVVNIAGFYSDKADNKALGSVFFKLDIKSTEIQVKKFETIDLGFSSKIAGIMQNERKPIITDLYVRKLIANSDGGCTIIAEKYYESKQTFTYNLNGFPQTSYKTVYNYDEVLIMAKNADGTTRFNNFVKKTQTSINDGGYYSSFVVMLSNDKIGIVYNQDVTNEGDVMLATISDTGELDYKVLIKAMSYFVTVMPPESRQVSAKSAIIPTSKDRRFCLMRVTF